MNVQVDWDNWTPKDRATLLFVLRDGEVLLMRKKRGLGAGKVNGPGGRLHSGETPLEAAARETREELCVQPTGIEQRGELSFQFVDGYSIHVYVFVASGCEGDARETEEAIPMWTRLEHVPYDEMWADDIIWLPRVLAGGSVCGRFVFDGDRMLSSWLDD